MTKVRGFLIEESLVALVIAMVAVSCLYLTVSENKKNEREMELKTDRVYAEYVLKKCKLDQITVHGRLYRRGSTVNE